MIQSATVDGRPALIAFLDDEFEIVADENSATLIKVTFTDDQGGTVFLAAEKPKAKEA